MPIAHPASRHQEPITALLQAEQSGGTRLDELAQKRGQAASAEVIEARP